MSNKFSVYPEVNIFVCVLGCKDLFQKFNYKKFVMETLISIILLLCTASISAFIAKKKNRRVVLWFFLGFIFHIIAIVVIALLKRVKEPGEPSPETHIACPDCKQLIKNDSTSCVFCNCKLIPEVRLEKFKLKGNWGSMSVYENKVVLQGAPGLAAAMWGVNQAQKTFTYDSISSIEFSAPSIGEGEIRFNIDGSRGITNTKLLNNIPFVSNNDNTFKYLEKDYAEASQAKAYIEEQMIKSKQRQPQTVVNELSSADELRKFKQLLDDGVIPSEEFEKKKKESTLVI
jgi:hypothetical protein